MLGQRTRNMQVKDKYLRCITRTINNNIHLYLYKFLTFFQCDQQVHSLDLKHVRQPRNLENSKSLIGKTALLLIIIVIIIIIIIIIIIKVIGPYKIPRT